MFLFGTSAVLSTLSKFLIKCSTVPSVEGAYGVTLVCWNPRWLTNSVKCLLLYGGPLSASKFNGMLKSVSILSRPGRTGADDVDSTISTAGNREYRNCNTIIYFVFSNGPNRSARRLVKGACRNGVIFSGSCCLVSVVIWHVIHDDSSLVILVSILENHIRDRTNCLVSFDWRFLGITTVVPFWLRL